MRNKEVAPLSLFPALFALLHIQLLKLAAPFAVPFCFINKELHTIERMGQNTMAR